jgi:2-methylisocitrate lyase-like PEP mutase family enzyme
MTTQLEKGRAFAALHESDETFVTPNPWRGGSACLLEKAGFKALATTSAGFATSVGKVEGEIGLEEKLAHCRFLASLTDIPISADFENGFADSPAEAAENLPRAAEAGVVGGSIEDNSGSEIYDFDLAACAQAVATLSFPFTLTARAEGLSRQSGDLDDIVKRLQAFEAADADVLCAPALSNLDEVKIVVDAVSKPINVLAAFMPAATLSQYAELGVRRLSVGSSLAIHTTKATVTAAKQMKDGRFD